MAKKPTVICATDAYRFPGNDTHEAGANTDLPAVGVRYRFSVY